MKLEADGCGGDSDNEAGAKRRRLRLLRNPSAGGERRDFVGQAVRKLPALPDAVTWHKTPCRLQAFSLISLFNHVYVLPKPYVFG